MENAHTRIASIKAYIPSRIVSNSEFETRFGTTAGSIDRKTGLRERRYSDPKEHPTDMGMHAIEMVLAETGCSSQEIDLIITAAASKDQPIPTDAMHYANRLGIRQVQTCHVESVCLSFIQALEIADLYIRSGRKRRILIISSEKCSKMLDPDDLDASVVLADGAAAALVEPNDGSSRIEASRIHTLASDENLEVATIKGGGTRYHPADPDFDPKWSYFYIDGVLQFRLSLRHFPALVQSLLADAGITKDELDYVIPHQIVPVVITGVARFLGFDINKVHIDNTLGNQAAASIPIAFARAIESGRVRRGNRVMLIGAAAGFSLGGVVLRF